jgi:GrpB-like predicted nucleotidyltransferase (UPF0157 family)
VPVDDQPVILRPTEELRGRADVVAEALRGELARLLPRAEVEHIGATAHPAGWTKGDVDLSVVVPADGFDDAVAALKDRFAVAQPENWTSTFASFSVDDRDLPVGLQLAVKGSGSDFLVALRDLLRDRPDLLEAYDDAKRAAAADGREAYWQAKDAFLADLLHTHLPDVRRDT